MNLAELPLITADLPGTGGQIKAEPDHFIVEEEPLYPPSGEGDHLFVQITRAGQTTRQVATTLAAHFGLNTHDVGYAGMKDRHARTTQVFSLPGVTVEQMADLPDDLGLEIGWATPNNRKLRVGHLLGNHFTITVLDPVTPDPLACAQATLSAIMQRGLPNYFGAQRFGNAGDNAEQGLAILTGARRRPGDKWLLRLLTSAYQAELFNQYLAERIRRGLFDRILRGDLAKKTDTGGMFHVEDVVVEQERFDRRQITYTGPLFGYDMWEAVADAAAFEAEILTASPAPLAAWRQQRVEGSRRPGCLFLQSIELRPHALGFTLRFFLPKGAYATMLLREVTKTEIAAVDMDD